jgi:hypothetical protein
MISNSFSIVFALGVTSFLLLIYIEFRHGREKRESFVENLQVYKTSSQTYRKCKREATRYVSNKIENCKSSSKRLLRKWKL